MLSKRKSRRKCGYMLLAIISDKAHQLSKRQESRWVGLRKVLLAASLNCLGHQGSQSEPDSRQLSFPWIGFLCLLLLQLPTSVCLFLGASGYF